jgi:hypothetical protein
MSAEGLRAAEEKMRAAGQPEEAIRAFAHSYERVERCESAFLRTSELEPVRDVPTLAELDRHRHRRATYRTADSKSVNHASYVLSVDGPGTYPPSPTAPSVVSPGSLERDRISASLRSR